MKMESSDDEEDPYEDVTFEKCKPKPVKIKSESEDQEDGEDVDKYVLLYKQKAVVVDVEVNTDMSAGGCQTERSFRNLLGVSILDMIIPLMVLGGAYLIPHFFQVGSGYLVKAKYLAILLACLLQLIMGVILLLKLGQKFFSNCQMTKASIGHHVLSVPVAGLQGFVIASTLPFGKDTPTGEFYFMVIQAAVVLVMRVIIFGMVEQARKTFRNQAQNAPQFI